MFRSSFSASAESFSSSASSSSAPDGCGCGCLECEQIHHIARRPSSSQPSLPSLTKLQIPATPLRQTPSSPITLQKQNVQMTSMGYSKLFSLGYFSATGALQSSG